jgi:hypothetical protein
MKDKRITYVLLPAVLVIWFVIGQRFYTIVGVDDAQLNFPKHPVQTSNDTVSEAYVFQMNYADPFLKEEKSQPNRPSVKLPLVQSAPTIPSAPPNKVVTHSTIDWGTIVYLGIIRNNQTDQQVGIITINGARKLVKVNDQFLPFAIGRITRDSIEIQHDRVVKYVYRQGYENRITKRN